MISELWNRHCGLCPITGTQTRTVAGASDCDHWAMTSVFRSLEAEPAWARHIFGLAESELTGRLSLGAVPACLGPRKVLWVPGRIRAQPSDQASRLVTVTDMMPVMMTTTTLERR